MPWPWFFLSAGVGGKANASADGACGGMRLVYGLVPRERSLELVELEMWRKRYTSRRVGKSAG